jgi:HK97 family phage portal protein
MAKDVYRASQDLPKSSNVVENFPQPPARKAEDYLNAYRGYPYSSITAIAHEVASIQLLLFRKKDVNGEIQAEPVNDHPSLSLLHFVNEYMTFYDLLEATQSYLELVGETFWIVLREGGTEGQPTEIFLVRPDWMKIVPSKKDFIKEYQYFPGGNSEEKEVIPPECVVNFKYFDPKNPYRGKGPVQAGAMAIDTRDFADDWNRNFFFNSAEPSLVFTSDKKIDEQVAKRFVESWQNAYGGRKKANKIAFLGGGFKMDKINATSKELDFEKQLNRMRDDVLANWKVPKTILGLTDDVNKANAFATTRSYMERVVTPRMRKFVAQLNEFFLPMFEGSENLFFDFVDPSPDDVELKLKTYENALNFGWMTVNEVRSAENLPPLEGGDEIEDEGSIDAPEEDEEKRIPQMLRKAKHMIPVPPKSLKELEINELAQKIQKKIYGAVSQLMKKEVDKPKISEEDKEKREKIWRQFSNRAFDKEAEMIKLMRILWDSDEKEILDKLNTLKGYTFVQRKDKISDLLPDLAQWNKEWLGTLLPFITDMVKEEGDKALDFVGVGGDLNMGSKAVVNYLGTDSVKLVKEINKNTRTKLRKTLAEGIKDGEGIPTLRKRVRKVFTMGRKSRSENIARSETIRAFNFGAEQGYIQSEVVAEKEWLTSVDDRVCPWCNNMEGTTIKLGKPYFKKGTTLTVENDEGKKVTLPFNVVDVDGPPLHPQCRCTLIPVIE